MQDALVFTRTKHRANRLAEYLVRHGRQGRAHSRQPLAVRSARRRSPASRTARIRVLVATDIAARGIDVEALGHVVNFDVPAVPEDYIHRVGRTARAELTGDAFTFVAPDEEATSGTSSGRSRRRLPRVTVPDFDYAAKPEGKLEIPLAERLAKHRANKSADRSRAAEKAKRRPTRGAPGGPRGSGRRLGPAAPGGPRGGGGGRPR